MKYTQQDLQRAKALCREYTHGPTLDPEDAAQLIADVRREERERCLKEYENTPVSEYDAEQMHDGVEYVCRVEWDHLYERLSGE